MSTTKTIEVNLDGLVGPTHHYAGLAYGNEASMQHAHQRSCPKQAALQSLKKMKLLHDLGVAQVIMPPAPRPNLKLLEQCGFYGSTTQKIQQAFKHAPHILSACFSASNMWTANAATITPLQDSMDQKIHITPANLVSQIHRSQEAEFTYQILKKIFPNQAYFTIHQPLPFSNSLADEGAANTQRLCNTHHDHGFNLFVYGRSSFHHTQNQPVKYPGRQTIEAQQAISRQHLRNPNNVFYAQQSPEAIDAGVFHHDVAGLNNENVLIIHKQALAKQTECLSNIKNAVDFELKILEILPQDLTLSEAVQTYFFNSQLVTIQDNTMVLIAPEECREFIKTQNLIRSLQQHPKLSISAVHYINLKQSMQNGGGPACLRLRIPMTIEAYETMHSGVKFTPVLFNQLESWINRHYRDHLSWTDLLDPDLIREADHAYQELNILLKLNSL